MPNLTNTIMYWHNGASYVQVTDHNRGSLSTDIERIERKQRMVDGTLRRYTVAKKRTWSCSWEMLPSTNIGAGMHTADGGMAGEDIEAFHDTFDGAFQMQLRKGNGSITVVNVMIADYSREVVKRGPNTDFWNVSITLEEV
jgi:hypothetical protein